MNEEKAVRPLMAIANTNIRVLNVVASSACEASMEMEANEVVQLADVGNSCKDGVCTLNWKPSRIKARLSA